MGKSENTSERKERIVVATVECITRFGYHNFSMQDVAKTAGISKGIIHYYFLNKDELLMSVLQFVSKNIESELTEIMDSKDPAKEKLKRFLVYCFRIVKERKEYYQVNMDFWTQINQKPAIQKMISDHYQTFRKSAFKLIQEFNKSEEEAMKISAIIIGLVDGLSIQWLFDSTSFPFDETVEMANQIVLKELMP